MSAAFVDRFTQNNDANVSAVSSEIFFLFTFFILLPLSLSSYYNPLTITSEHKVFLYFYYNLLTKIYFLPKNKFTCYYYSVLIISCKQYNEKLTY